MSEAKRTPQAKKMENEMEVAAPVERVWNALTNSAELTRWSPLEATVEPGRGGKVSLSWGPEWTGTAAIEIWEPNRRLRLIETVSGQPIMLDWTIGSRGEKTLIRITQSGFASG